MYGWRRKLLSVDRHCIADATATHLQRTRVCSVAQGFGSVMGKQLTVRRTTSCAIRMIVHSNGRWDHESMNMNISGDSTTHSTPQI